MLRRRRSSALILQVKTPWRASRECNECGGGPRDRHASDASALSARREEGLKDGGALRDEDAGRHLHLMIEARIGEDLEAGADSTALGVVGAVNQSRNAGL